MIIFFQEIVSLLPVIVLCITTFFVLLFILIYRNHYVTFFITIFGICLSFLSLYFVWNNGIQKVTNLVCVDGFSLLCMGLVLISSLLSSIIFRIWLLHYCSFNNNNSYYDEFYLLLLIVNIGSMFVINASHVVTLFFGIELVSLPLFGLMSYFNVYKYSLEATIKYVLLSGISISFLLFGISLIYAETKNLSFSNIYLELVNNPSLNESKLLMSGVIMVLLGLGFKLSLVPFHLWTADVYQGISEISGMCLATISKISIFSVLVRFFLLFPESYNTVSYFLVLVACLSILFGNVMATRQNNIKRVLAYSSVAHMGYLLVGVIGTMKESRGGAHYIISLLENGVEIISFGLINYLFSTLGIFSMLCLLFCCFYSKNNNIENDNGKEEDIGMLSLYYGLFWKDPIFSIIFTVFVLSLAGIPITLGFISKFYLIILGMKSGLLCCIVFIIFGISISMLYYLRIVTILYLSPLYKIRNRCLGLLLPQCSGITNRSVISISVIKDYYYQRYFSILFGIFLLLVICLFLLYFGIYPQCLTNLFSLIQNNF